MFFVDTTTYPQNVVRTDQLSNTEWNADWALADVERKKIQRKSFESGKNVLQTRSRFCEAFGLAAIFALIQHMFSAIFHKHVSKPKWLLDDLRRCALFDIERRFIKDFVTGSWTHVFDTEAAYSLSDEVLYEIGISVVWFSLEIK